jgi:hypothetical protein
LEELIKLIETRNIKFVFDTESNTTDWATHDYRLVNLKTKLAEFECMISPENNVSVTYDWVEYPILTVAFKLLGHYKHPKGNSYAKTSMMSLATFINFIRSIT